MEKIVTIDAKGKKIGRLATEISTILNGKDNPNYQPNIAPNVQVKVENVSKMYIDPKKQEQKEYQRYSGYFSGRKVTTMDKLIEKKGYGEVLRKAVYGMLPANKLRSPKMKKLRITE